jgi:subtilisin-like proprotein convertase family protein
MPSAAQGFFSVTGPGGSIPSSGSGGGGASSYPSSFPPFAFTSQVQVPSAVAVICRVQIEGLRHTWIGDVQIALIDPTGRGCNLLVRPGFDSAGSYGNSGDFTGGAYEFVASGGGAVPDTASTDMPPGVYDQHFGDPGGVPWPDGQNQVFNLALSQVTGPAGTWTLRIWDWSSGDSGACTGWRLEGNGSCTPLPPAPTTYCTSKTTSIGCVPTIAASGVASASAGSGFIVSGFRTMNRKPGTLLYSLNGAASVPFQGGYLCIASPTKRTPQVASGGSLLPASDCTGAFVIDMNAFAVGALGGTPAPALVVAGTVVNCQWWGRDPGFAAPYGTQLSNGLQYTVGL